MKTLLSACLLALCLGHSFVHAFGGERVTSFDIVAKKDQNIRVFVYKAETVPAPTVLVLHGCGGVEPHHRDWGRQLVQWGFNAVVVDSFNPRWANNVCIETMKVSPLQRAIDAHLTARWVLEQPWSTPKVGAIGFSHGGVTVLHAATAQDAKREVNGAWLTSAVAFYPYCTPVFNFSSRAIPLQIHIGAADDWTPASICRDLVRNWEMTDAYFEYPGAHHGFDRYGADFQIQGNADRIATRTLRSHPEANAQARERVKEFFDATLR